MIPIDTKYIMGHSGIENCEISGVIDSTAQERAAGMEEVILPKKTPCISVREIIKHRGVE